MRVAGTQQLVVVVLGIAVHLVVRPDVHVSAVNTGDKHAVAGQMGVPSRLLAVLDGEELVLHWAAQDVSLAAGVHGIKRIRARLGKLTALGPSQRIAFIVGITHWAAAEVVVTPISHDVPAARMMALAAPILIVGIIKVGQAQHMRELVSHGADALHGDGVRRRLKAVQLGRARITVDFLAVIR